ncbi:MAG: anaerobic ribonucleoside-triphosphate reductase activating protein [Thermodesulfobacteriota bacterium]|nr:anaerobic ribonucleoside-triphosphate reductase activating protein [Thermodesulfobacteriota bacterium]
MIQESALVRLMKNYLGRIEGITLSGGEPLYQSSAVQDLLKRVREETGLSVVIYSGYSLEEIIVRPLGGSILQLVDILIAGRFESAKRAYHSVVASSNQQIHFLTSRYRRQDLERWSQGELLIDAQGVVTVSGVQLPSLVPQNEVTAQP